MTEIIVANDALFLLIGAGVCESRKSSKVDREGTTDNGDKGETTIKMNRWKRTKHDRMTVTSVRKECVGKG